MSETKRSRWHISCDVRIVRTVTVVVLMLVGAVWGVCECIVSELDLRFHQQNARLDRIESTMAEGFRQFHAAMEEGFRQSHAAMAEGFRLSHGGINRPEEKVDAIGPQGGKSTPAPVAKPGGFSATSSWPLLRDR